MEGPVERCGLCGSERLETVLRLGATPPACSMLPVGDEREQKRFPLDLLRCLDCSLVQLGYIVDPLVVFHAEYPYASGTNRQLVRHFADLAARLDATGTVVDVGANDGTFLQRVPPDCHTVAIDPTRQVLKSLADVQIQGFFSSHLADEIVAEHGHAQYVTAFNVLAHVADPHEFLEGVRTLLADDGVLVTENHHLASIVDGGQWDTVYHEHLRYYDQTSLTLLLQRHGFGVDSHERVDIHGGSFRTFARKGGFHQTPMRHGYDFAGLRGNAERVRRDLCEMVERARARGERVGAVGATARATTILGHAGLDVNDVEAVYEVAASDKIGRYMPGTRIPVVDEAALAEPDAPEVVILFLWYMADGIIPRLRDLGYDGTFIIPLPEVRHLAEVHA